MFVCDECGHIFDQPDYETWHENHGNGIVEPWTAKVCPKCGSDQIYEVDPDMYDLYEEELYEQFD